MSNRNPNWEWWVIASIKPVDDEGPACPVVVPVTWVANWTGMTHGQHVLFQAPVVTDVSGSFNRVDAAKIMASAIVAYWTGRKCNGFVGKAGGVGLREACELLTTPSAELDAVLDDDVMERLKNGYSLVVSDTVQEYVIES